MSERTREIPLDELPEWLRPLTAAARTVAPEQLSRFLPPPDGSGRASAVLMAFADAPAGASLLLIQRAASLRNHAGQVAFPGGAVDDDDPGHVAAALREAEEEVGLDPAAVRVVAELPRIFLPPSGFVVTPVLAWWTDVHPVAPVDVAEVARVALVPIAALADPANRFRVVHPSGWLGPGFEVDGLFVWGFTGGLVAQLLALGGWEQPWDEQRHLPLPAEFAGGWVPPRSEP
jgi:8-oxo-dGTP pyrophosphatase MutT (NUDIX family)